MKWSIIIPTYNRAWTIEKTLACIQAQTLVDWECIVVDDGSTDETRALVEMLARRDQRIRYVYQDNARQAAARNTGLLHARGEWVTYVDSDDEVYPQYLEVAQHFFDIHPHVSYAICAQDRTLEKQDSAHRVVVVKREEATAVSLQSITLKDFAEWRVKPCGTGLFHRRDISTPPIVWDTEFRLLEDLDFLLQLGTAYPDSFGYIPEKLYHQHQTFGTEGVCSNASYADWADAFEQLYQKHADKWFMEEQRWYPEKVISYRNRQQLFEKGKLPAPDERYFQK